MKIPPRTEQINKGSLSCFTNEEGAIDLASIMVGIIVIGLIGGVIAATVFAVIPWTQDKAAKQQLDSVTAAQSAYMGLSSAVPQGTPAGHPANSYGSSLQLEEAGLLKRGSMYCTVTTNDAKGYTVFAKSASGEIWSASDRKTDPEPLVGTLPADCEFLNAGDGTVPPPNSFAKLTLTQQAGSPTVDNGSGNYYDIASSSDGSILIATSNVGRVFKSTDSGVTWAPMTGLASFGWQGAAISGDGTRMAVTEWNGIIRLSNDSGNTWTATATAMGNVNWRDIAMSRDGKHLVAGIDNGAMYYSHDFGATWNLTSNGSSVWKSFAVSDDGQTILAASASVNQLFISKNGGATWGKTAPATSKNYSGVSVSADGQTILGGQGYGGTGIGGLEISTDGGATWQMPGGVNSDQYRGTSMSADGTKMIVVGARNTYINAVYTSIDSGTTWQMRDIGGTRAQWYGATMSSDGSKLAFASISGQKIYTGLWE